ARPAWIFPGRAPPARAPVPGRATRRGRARRAAHRAVSSPRAEHVEECDGNPAAVLVAVVERRRREAEHVRLAEIADDAVLGPQPPRERTGAVAGDGELAAALRWTPRRDHRDGPRFRDLVEQLPEVGRQPFRAGAERVEPDAVELLERGAKRREGQYRRRRYG